MTGSGRLADNEAIVAAALEALGASQDLAGETVLITAGPTREKIDPVRYLTNRSSGRMGYALAEAALRRGARVLLVSGPTSIAPPGAAELTRVESTRGNARCGVERFSRKPPLSSRRQPFPIIVPSPPQDRSSSAKVR